MKDINPTEMKATSNEPLPVREQIIDFLRRELVGPDPVPPYVQDNGEETLVNDPPRLRYGAAVLFPQIARMEDAIGIAPDEESDVETLPEGDEGRVYDPTDDLVGGGLTGDGDGVEEADQIISLANAFLPSAMGFSCLTEIPTCGFVAEIRAATYTSRSVPAVTKDGRAYQSKHWDRRPFASSIVIPSAEIIGAGTKTWSVTVLRDDKPANLELHILSRPFNSEDSAGENLRLITLSVINTQLTPGGRASNEQCFFQVELQLHSADDSGVFLEYPNASLDPDEEEQSLALLYRYRKTYAIGHGCAAAWCETTDDGRANIISCDVLPVHEIKPIVPSTFDDLNLSMLVLSDRGNEAATIPLLSRLCDTYATWITEQQARVDGVDFPDEHLEAAARHLSKCNECLQRMRSGVEILRDDATVRQAFRLANRAMLQQQLHYALGTDSQQTRSWSFDRNGSLEIAPVEWPDIEKPPKGKGAWYPFQLAFLLMNLRSLADPNHSERRIVDLIWFPTGGGKTEAYLGLTAFTILIRRLRNSDDAGTTVLMRYTLRLLTAQQFQRAASLICALEKIRREGDMPGDSRISIGLWAGGDLTPNRHEDARQALQKLFDGDTGENKFVLLNCPWCGARMGPVDINGTSRIIGYESERNPPVVLRCKDPGCEFSDKRALPLTVIDEDMYESPPTLLLGTVDKFAMLPWKPEAMAFFGMKDGMSPPDLIIQDELHLISGPLGSMVGHYETVIQELCNRRDTNGRDIAPKIVASTATISRAAEQCHALWNCGDENVFQFPPQCLKAGDSFFAREDEAASGRKYVGVHASALSSHVTAQVRVMATLLQAPLCVQVDNESKRDPYWTLIGYYNSLRELGHAATLIRADIREHINAMWLRLGIKKPEEDGDVDARRFINRDLELTSRIPSSRIPESLQQLFATYPASDDNRPVDVVLATNMISVGVDVPRLGLMAVAGQPKTTSEYIQATSRVGRSSDGPGLVVMIYNTSKPRDRSHYEHFHSYHNSIYRAVEPTSVTPFSSPVRDRALHALLTTLVRYRGTPENRDRPQPMPDTTLLRAIERIVNERVTGVDVSERSETLKQLQDAIDHWERIQPPRYGGFGPLREEIPLLYPAGSEPSAKWEKKSWPTPTSMRDVDATCEAQVVAQYPQPSSSQGDSSVPEEANGQ